MKIGCTLTNMEDIEKAMSSGVDYIEFLGKAVVSLDDFQYEGLKRRVQSEKVPVEGMNAYCPPEIVIAGPGFSEQSAREYAKKIAYRAAGLGVKKVGVGSPASRNLPPDMSWEDGVSQLERFLDVTVQECRSYGIVVCLEALATCYCNFINRTEEALHIVERMQDPNIRLVLDFYNMEIMKEADVDLERFAKYISHVHISDDDGEIYKRSYLKPEKTQIHQKRLRSLKATGYDGTVSIEIDVPVIPERLKQSIKIIRDI